MAGIRVSLQLLDSCLNFQKLKSPAAVTFSDVKLIVDGKEVTAEPEQPSEPEQPTTPERPTTPSEPTRSVFLPYFIYYS